MQTDVDTRFKLIDQIPCLIEMEHSMRLLFLNHRPLASERDEIHELLRSYASHGTEIEFGAPDDFPGGAIPELLGRQRLSNGLCHAVVTPAVVKKVIWAERNGFDAVVQSNTFDPGVEIARLCVKIPVIGVFRAALHLAATLSSRIGVAVPLPGLVPHTRRIIQNYGMSSWVSDVRSFDMYGTAAELGANREGLKNAAISCMKSLVQDTGAESIIPLGGVLIPYILPTHEISEVIGVPVINTKAAGIRFAELCYVSGVSHSPLTYPLSPLGAESFDWTVTSLTQD